MIRAIERADVPAAVALVHQLAADERAADSCLLTGEQLTAALYGDGGVLHGLVAVEDGEVVGVALWFLNFSTWVGTPGVYLEDLVVAPAHRGAGHGAALLAALAAICVERGYARLDWAALRWNAGALRFYARIGADVLDQWLVHRMTGAALQRLADGAAPGTQPGR